METGRIEAPLPGIVKSRQTKINRALQQLDQVIQQNSSASEEMASTSEELASQAEQLKEIISFFKVGDKHARMEMETRRPGTGPGKPPHAAPPRIRENRLLESKYETQETKDAGASGSKAGGGGVDINMERDTTDGEFERY